MHKLYALLASFLIAGSSGCTLPRPQNTNLWHKIPENPTFLLGDKTKDINVLCISGGGSNGAFGAGFINGWQNKPKFQYVTGVSAGSLLSVYAFLDNPEYNKQLKDIFLNLNSNAIIDYHPLTLMAFNNSVSSNDKVQSLISKYITDKMIDEVGQEFLNKRTLLVGTTDMDFSMFRQWDLTEIAYQKDYKKFRQILLTSCSIPLIYSPQFLDNSLNCDGGILENCFMPDIKGIYKSKNMYVIYNGKPWDLGQQQTPNSLKSIAVRYINISSEKSHVDSLNQILNDYTNTSVHYIEVDANVKLLGLSFDPKDMQNMFDTAVLDGQNNKWTRIIENN